MKRLLNNKTSNKILYIVMAFIKGNTIQVLHWLPRLWVKEHTPIVIFLYNIHHLIMKLALLYATMCMAIMTMQQL